MPQRSVLATKLVILGIILLALAGISWAMSQRNSANDSESSRLREQGLALFIAKGCVTCHYQEEVNALGFSSDIGRDSMPASVLGPDLTDLATRYPPGTESLDYLRSWLKDPTALKPEATMPALELNEMDIEALLHFLLSEDHF